MRCEFGAGAGFQKFPGREKVSSKTCQEMLGWDKRDGGVWQAAGEFCFLCKRDPF